jgi:hypothetical protein
MSEGKRLWISSPLAPSLVHSCENFVIAFISRSIQIKFKKIISGIWQAFKGTFAFSHNLIIFAVIYKDS